MMHVSSNSVFDHLAPDYDESFTDRPPAQWLRQQVRLRVARLLPSEARILDIGCGTGDDALWFASQGHTVVATDVSDGMLEQTRLKCDQASDEIRARISIARFDAAKALDFEAPGNDQFDLILSNFGALNCVADLQTIFAWIDKHISPKGIVALTLMGRFCAWETAGFTLRGDFRRASRRWRGKSTYEIGGVSQPVWYHSPSTIRRMAAEFFIEKAVYGIGVIVPSTEFFPVCEKRPRLLKALTQIEDLFGGWWPFNRMGDHYLIVLSKENGGHT